jgi:hypothetical protein
MNLLVVAMALFVLKPMRARMGARENAKTAAVLQPGE